MQIPILNGVYTDRASNVRTSYPRNLVPVPKSSGVSDGFLRPADGIIGVASGTGIDRGGIEWNGVLYRVLGTKLCSISEGFTITELGDVGGTGQVTLDYSFDYLAIASSEKFFLYRPSTGLQQVTDEDLGPVVDFCWVDGYFMTTDGEFLIVTELTDPFSVNPLKYGSSEADPDPILSLVKLRNEVYAINRHTIEVFNNVGGSGFPFQRVEGGQVQKGCIGTHAACLFLDGIAFMGGARNEAPAIYITAGATSQKISSREVDLVLLRYTEAQLADTLIESRTYQGLSQLYIHLPGVTYVYDAAASAAMGQPIWFTLSSSLNETAYRGRNMIWCYNKWIVGDPFQDRIGYLTQTVSSHWGEKVGWECTTPIMYNNSKGVILHDLELVSLTGRAALGDDPTIWTSWSLDGEVWSQEWTCRAGVQGNRAKRIIWFRQGTMQTTRIQRFRGTSDAHISILRLEATVEPLYV